MTTKIGHFEVLSELSRSAMGAVFKVNDPKGGQTLALKTIRLEAFGDCAADLKTCLVEEGERAKSLHNPNLTAASDSFEIDGQFCATMEYIQGNSVATMLARQEGFSIWDLLDIGRQVCSGLDYAHARKVFHYSLEPAKIMCGWDGTVRVLGFGVSSIGKFSGQLPGVSPILHYMSPEQMRGGLIDSRSNIFSLGALFYAMVTERQAFDGADFEALRTCVLEGAPVPPIDLNPKLHPLLNDLILKSLAKDPDARYQSGRELLEDLEQCKESKPAAKLAAAPAKAAPPAASAAASAQAKFASAPAAQPASIAVELPRKASAIAGPATAFKAAPLQPPVADLRKKVTAASANRSASVLEEPAIQTFEPVSSNKARFSVDPMMAAEAPARGNKVSFSEMTELPPLKEIYVSTPAPPSTEAEPPYPAEDFSTESPATKAGNRAGTKNDERKLQPREAAQNALKEIKGVPPSLLVYAVAAAAVVILIIAIGLVLHINHLNREEDSARPTSALASPYSAQPAPPQPDTQNLDQSASPAEIPPQSTDSQPAVARSNAAPRSRYGKRNKTVPATAPVVLPGQMAIDSTPQGAQFQIDGKTDPSWITPFTLTALNPGMHAITVSKAGYATDTRNVEVPSGSKAFVVTHLTQLMATLSVSSSPAGANVYVDGRDTGKLTPAQVSVEKGQHSILVRKQGFLDETTSAQFVLSQTVTFSPTLRALGNVDDLRTVNKISKLFGGKDEKGMGTVFVRTQPKGAQVAVNQHMVGKNSPVDVMLDPGNYIVDITLTGYTPIHKVITVDKGGKAVIDEVMTHE
jgi:hypothetical protein